MQKEIRKALERSLPQYVLDYLTEEFNKFEQCFEKLKYMEKKHEQMLYDLAEKDRVIYRALEKSGVVKEGNSEIGGSIGFDYASGGRSYGPWDRRGRSSSGQFTSGDWDEEEGPYMRRGVPGSGRGRYSDFNYDESPQMARGRNAGTSNRYDSYASEHPNVYAPSYPNPGERSPYREPQDAQGGQGGGSGRGSSGGSQGGSSQGGSQSGQSSGGGSSSGQSGESGGVGGIDSSGAQQYEDRGLDQGNQQVDNNQVFLDPEKMPRYYPYRNPYPEEKGEDPKPGEE